MRIAESLRDKGHDAIAIIERGWQLESDESLLSLCRQENRALMTNNVSDFMPIHRLWQAQDLRHAGLILTSDKSLPRTRAGIGACILALETLFATHPATNALADQMLWLKVAPR